MLVFKGIFWVTRQTAKCPWLIRIGPFWLSREAKGNARRLIFNIILDAQHKRLKMTTKWEVEDYTTAGANECPPSILSNGFRYWGKLEASLP